LREAYTRISIGRQSRGFVLHQPRRSVESGRKYDARFETARAFGD
jgi:hypothetical protein